MKKHTSVPAVLIPLEAQLRNISALRWETMGVCAWGCWSMRKTVVVGDEDCSQFGTDCSGVLHLPEDVVDGVAQEAFPVVRRQKFGPQYCHELLKVHLAVPCGTQRKQQRERETEIQTDTQTRRQATAKCVYQFISLAKTKQIASRQINRRMRPGPWQTPTHLSNRCWLWAQVVIEGRFFANWNSEEAPGFVCVLCILLQHAPTDRNQQAPCGVTVTKHFCLSACVMDLNLALWSYIFPLLVVPNFPFIDKKIAFKGLCCSLSSHIGKLITVQLHQAFSCNTINPSHNSSKIWQLLFLKNAASR